MRTLRHTVFALIGSAFMVACSEQQPVAPDTQLTPNFTATVSNDLVYLFPGRITWLYNDPATDPPDVLLLGYDPADDFACDPSQQGGILAREHLAVSQEGFPWGQRDQYILTTIGRPPMYMYRLADLPAEPYPDDPWCAFQTDGWIAAGNWSATLAQDNDLSGGGTPGTNSFGGTEAGILWGRDGDMYRYEWKYRYIYDPARGVFEERRNVDHVVQIK